MQNFNFNQYVGKQVQIGLRDEEVNLTATLQGVNEYGLFLVGGNYTGTTFKARFYPWTVIDYVDLSQGYSAQAA